MRNMRCFLQNLTFKSIFKLIHEYNGMLLEILLKDKPVLIIKIDWIKGWGFSGGRLYVSLKYAVAVF